MTWKFRVSLALMLIIAVFVFTASCAKKQIKSEPGIAAGQQETGTEEIVSEKQDMEGQRAIEEQRLQERHLRQEAKARRERTEKEEFLNEKIYFQFDKSTLLPEAKATLREKAKWLLAHSSVSVIIEGHCDERGTGEYNIALGDRRGRSAKSYLVNLGVGSHRMTTISYGEEKPIALGHNERAWAKNRRAQFVIE